MIAREYFIPSFEAIAANISLTRIAAKYCRCIIFIIIIILVIIILIIIAMMIMTKVAERNRGCYRRLRRELEELTAQVKKIIMMVVVIMI